MINYQPQLLLAGFLSSIVPPSTLHPTVRRVVRRVWLQVGIFFMSLLFDFFVSGIFFTVVLSKN